MNVITYISILVAALYVNVSFVIQIAFFDSIQTDWLGYIGLDNFDSNKDSYLENISAYAITVVVYITCLIYRKAAYRHSLKEKYLQQKYPEKFVKKTSGGGLKVRKFNKSRKNVSMVQSIFIQLTNLFKNPFMHLFIVRIFLFFWIFLYFAFQSLVPLFCLWHSIIYIKREFFMNALKYFYLPLLFLIFYFDYAVNIEGMFGKRIYSVENRRYGIFRYDPSFVHLLFQISTLFYCWFTCYLFREYDKYLKKLNEKREKREKRKQARRERTLTELSNHKSSVASESMMTELDLNSKGTVIYTYEILMRYILKHIDILLMIVLYIAGVNRIDVYHMSLLIIFVIYIMFPEQFRKRFIFLLYFMIFINTFK